MSDNFLDSAWYFFRYPSSNRDDVPFGEEMTRKWLPVDMYIGGKEHSVLHLMYTRFVTMAFKDMGLIDFEEPFKRFRAHGLIVKDGSKMSKSKGNVVNPDEYIVGAFGRRRGSERCIVARVGSGADAKRYDRMGGAGEREDQG